MNKAENINYNIYSVILLYIHESKKLQKEPTKNE